MSEHEIRHVLVHPALLPALERWLAGLGLELRRAPGDTWIVTPTDERLEALREAGR